MVGKYLNRKAILLKGVSELNFDKKIMNKIFVGKSFYKRIGKYVNCTDDDISFYRNVCYMIANTLITICSPYNKFNKYTGHNRFTKVQFRCTET